MKMLMSWPGIVDLVMILAMLNFFLGDSFYPAAYYVGLLVGLRVIALYFYSKSYFVISFRGVLNDIVIIVLAVFVIFIMSGEVLGLKDILVLYLGAVSLSTIVVWVLVNFWRRCK